MNAEIRTEQLCDITGAAEASIDRTSADHVQDRETKNETEGVKSSNNTKVYIDKASLFPDEIMKLEANFKTKSAALRTSKSSPMTVFGFAIYYDGKISHVTFETEVNRSNEDMLKIPPNIFFKILRKSVEARELEGRKEGAKQAVFQSISQINIGDDFSLSDLITPVFSIWPKLKEQVKVEARLIMVCDRTSLPFIQCHTLDEIFAYSASPNVVQDTDFSQYTGSMYVPLVNFEDIKNSPAAMPLLGKFSSLLMGNGKRVGFNSTASTNSSPFKF